MRRLIAALAALAAMTALLLTTGVASAVAAQRFFLFPTRNISCELDVNSSVGTQAYCETFQPAGSVTMTATGRLKICHGMGCLGQPPENATTLGYGHQLRLGPFHCVALNTAVSCTVSPSGKGFRIGRTGIARL